MRAIFLISLLFAFVLGFVQNSVIDTSNEIKKAETYEKLISCLVLIEMKFDSSRQVLAEKFSESLHKDKSKLYDKFYYTTLKFCMGKIKEVDWKFIPRNALNPAEVDKLNIVWVISNEMNERVLKDKKISLELDEEELKIKQFIDQDEKIEEYLPKIEKPQKKKKVVESKKDEKVEEVEQKQEEIPKIEKEAQQTNNEIPLSFNMENLNQTSIFIGVGGFIAVLLLLLCCCCGGSSEKPEQKKVVEKKESEKKEEKAEKKQEKKDEKIEKKQDKKPKDKKEKKN